MIAYTRFNWTVTLTCYTLKGIGLKQICSSWNNLDNPFRSLVINANGIAW